MSLRLSTLLGLGLAGLGLLASLHSWPHLPDPMPIHWDGRGHPDGYGSRAFGALVMPALMAGMGALFLLLARISPVGFSLRRFEGTVGIFAVAIESFLLGLHLETLRAASSGRPLSMGLLGFGVGLLFVVLGNRMGKVRRNFFIGVRTPWTLADEEVWSRTHRLAGKLFVACGLLVMVLGSLGGPPLWVAPLLVASLVPVVYSYLIYRRLHPLARL